MKTKQKNDAPLLPIVFADPVGRQVEQRRKRCSPGEQITDLRQIQPGDRIFIESPQFRTTNHAIFISRDRTGLNRDIGYARFDRGLGVEPEFAIWQHELDLGSTTIKLPRWS
jgi:hypothetical protein